MTTPDTTTAAGTAAGGTLQTFTAGHFRQATSPLKAPPTGRPPGNSTGINLGPDKTNRGLKAQNNTPVEYVNA
jgi:hypothetical protein